MAYKARTTRRMPPKTRKLAKLINDLASVQRRLKNLLPEIQTAEMYERGERQRQEHLKAQEKRAIDEATEKFVTGSPTQQLF